MLAIAPCKTNGSTPQVTFATPAKKQEPVKQVSYEEVKNAYALLKFIRKQAFCYLPDYESSKKLSDFMNTYFDHIRNYLQESKKLPDHVIYSLQFLDCGLKNRKADDNKYNYIVDQMNERTLGVIVQRMMWAIEDVLETCMKVMIQENPINNSEKSVKQINQLIIYFNQEEK